MEGRRIAPGKRALSVDEEEKEPLNALPQQSPPSQQDWQAR